MVLGLDQLVQLLAEFRLDCAPEGVEVEAVPIVRGGRAFLFVGSYGKCAIPVLRQLNVPALPIVFERNALTDAGKEFSSPCESCFETAAL